MGAEALLDVISEVGRKLKERQWLLAGAESCTGGLVSSLLTDVSGSSEWFAGTVVSYADHVKRNVLGVPPEVLDSRGAVSRETVEAMALGACRVADAEVSFAVSGIAGPTGGTPGKPVGTVWMAWACRGRVRSKVFHFKGDRAEVKAQSAEAAIQGIADMLAEEGE